MTKKHLTIDELVERLYGVDHPDDGHLDDCEECAERFQQLLERRKMAAEPVPASYEFLAAQRRSIYSRMGDRPPGWSKWAPAFAAGAAFLVIAGAFMHHPATQMAKPEVVDPQLFADVYSMEQSMEPLAAKPIDALFEQDQP